jgi:hypothetical protein
LKESAPAVFIDPVLSLLNSHDEKDESIKSFAERVIHNSVDNRKNELSAATFAVNIKG